MDKRLFASTVARVGKTFTQNIGDAFGPRSRASRRACFAVIGLSASIAIAGCSNDIHYRQVECINIASGEKLTNTDNNTPQESRFGFYGTDKDGFTRTVNSRQAPWWKCREVVQ